MAKRRPPKVIRRKRRPLLKLVVALVALGLAFGGAAIVTVWVIETTGLMASSTEGPAEDFSSEERRALERLIEEGAAKKP